MMRAKVKVYSVNNTANCDTIYFSAVCKSGPYGEDGLDEDNTYAKYTPSADFKITITNPALLNKFNIGDTFYVDFTPV